MDPADVEQALLALDERARAAVIRRGLRSLGTFGSDANQGDVGAGWRAELRHRINEIENDNVELLDVDESHARLRDELAARRK